MGNYNYFAEEYAKGTEDFNNAGRELFHSLLPPLQNKTILDVGCGSGHDAEYYSAQGATVYGLDISEKQIELAKQRNCAIFTIHDMNDIPYEANQFDIVTSFYALQNAEEVSRVLLEMIRVVKPGGTVLILTTHPFRNLLESHINDGNPDYYAKRMVTSHIFNRTIKLSEPGHTLMDYLTPSVLAAARLELLVENTDFPASEQVIDGLIYPTFMILKYQKNG